MSVLLYLDCPSGVSGDMLLGALIDLGADAEELRAGLRALPLPAWTLEVGETRRAGLRAVRAQVQIGGADTPQRTLGEIKDLLDGAALPPRVRARAGGVFRRLAEAEARVHGEDVATLHVHEVGRADALIDVVGVLLAIEQLGVEAVYCSPLPLAMEGTANSGHGLVPLPAPATLEILRAVQAPLRRGASDAASELVTPTGAALVAELARFERPALRLQRLGAGAGRRDPAERANLLRAWLAEGDAPGAALPVGVVAVLETTIDDMSAEQIAFARERLSAAGALDVWLQAVLMKKGRAGLQVTVVAPPEAEAPLAATLLRETSTLGVRAREERRYEAPREERRVETPLGQARVKVARPPGAPPRVAAEFEDCAALARRHDRPIAEVYALVERAARDQLGGG